MRSQNPVEGVRWDLSLLFASLDDPEIKKTAARVLNSATEFELKYKGKITELITPVMILTMLEEYERIEKEFERIIEFAHLMRSTDLSDAKIKEFSDYAENLGREISARLVFMNVEWNRISDSKQEEFASDPLLGGYSHYLKCLSLMKKHTMSEPEERVSLKLSPIPQKFRRLHSEINSSLRYPWTENGRTVGLTRSELGPKQRSSNPEERKKYYEVLHSTLSDPLTGLALTACYEGVVHERLLQDELRGFKDPLDANLVSQEIDRRIFDAVVLTVENNFPIAHEYFGLKEKLLGKEKLDLYDQYAPLFPELVPKTYSYEEAKDMVLAAYYAIDNRIGDLAKSFFDEKRIHAELLPNKRSGAFCSSTTPNLPVYVLVNFKGTPEDVSTLAHELGHGIHAELAKKQNVLNFNPTLVTAETASTFGEKMLFSNLFSGLTDDRARLRMLADAIEGSFVTIFRQITMTRFEQAAYEIRKTRPFAVNELCDLWMESQRPYYGSSVILPEHYRWGWIYIPHFISTRFYTYSYAFGEILTSSLWRKYCEEGASFVPRYIKLLEAGGSDSPQNLLAGIMGMDISTPEFWEKGMDELKFLVKEADELAKKLGLV